MPTISPDPTSVSLEIPASSAYLSLARAATNATCARLDFPIDRLDDVALAVDEAISLLLLDAVPGSMLRLMWTPTGPGVDIQITSVSSSGRTPRTTTFAWAVLSALVDLATAEILEGRVTITLSAERVPAVAP